MIERCRPLFAGYFCQKAPRMDGKSALAQSPASGTHLQPPATAPHPASTLTALRGCPPRPAKFAGKSCRQLSPLCARVAGSDLLSLSPEQVQAWLQTRLSRAGVNRDDPLSGASSPMPLPLLLDAAAPRPALPRVGAAAPSASNELVRCALSGQNPQLTSLMHSTLASIAGGAAGWTARPPSPQPSDRTRQPSPPTPPQPAPLRAPPAVPPHRRVGSEGGASAARSSATASTRASPTGLPPSFGATDTVASEMRALLSSAGIARCADANVSSFSPSLPGSRLLAPRLVRPAHRARRRRRRVLLQERELSRGPRRRRRRRRLGGAAPASPGLLRPPRLVRPSERHGRRAAARRHRRPLRRPPRL